MTHERGVECIGAEKLKCALINARSLINKTYEMKCFVHETSLHIIMVTGSWTREEIKDAELKLENYEIIRNDRLQQRGGGSLIYYRKDVSVSGLPEMTNVDGTETVWCKMHGSGAELVVGVCYQKPSAVDEEERALHQMISLACEKYNDVMICGDFNHRTINWETLHSEAEGRRFLELLMDCFLTQHVMEPTRGEITLDLVLTTNPHIIDKMLVSEPSGPSDHNIVEFEIIMKTDCVVWREEYYDYRHGDYAGEK